MAPAHYIKGAHADMSQPNMREAPPFHYTTRARLLVGWYHNHHHLSLSARQALCSLMPSSHMAATAACP
jgi:hypothetical protein